MSRTQCVACAALLGGALALQGCALFVVGVAAGAGAGAVSYAGNELRVTQEASMDRAWEATKGSAEELQYSIVSSKTHKDATGGILIAHNAKDQSIQVRLVRQSDRLVNMRIRVGVFSTSANRAAAQLMYEK